MTSPETMLRAARLARPDEPWTTAYNNHALYTGGGEVIGLFDPFDPTKGDLAALNEALEKAGWQFYAIEVHPSFEGEKGDSMIWVYRANRDNTSLRARSPAERALKCVEAMP